MRRRFPLLGIMLFVAPLLPGCIAGEAAWMPDLTRDMVPQELTHFRKAAWESENGVIADSSVGVPALFCPLYLKDLDGRVGMKDDGSLGYRFDEDFVLLFGIAGTSGHWSEYDDDGRRTAWSQSMSALLWLVSSEWTVTHLDTPVPVERVERSYAWGAVRSVTDGRQKGWSYLWGAFDSGDPVR